MRLGYSRVSTQDQTTNPQDDQLKKAGCEKIYRDTSSGAKAARPGLDALLSDARPGDTVVVWKLDRLGRSLQHLVSVVNALEQGGRKFVSLTEKIDTTTPGGKLIFHLFGALAEFERGIIVERTHAGLSAARARGRFGGRPKGPHDIKRAQMAAALLADHRNSVAEVCRVLGVSRATAYRLARIGRESRSQQPSAATTPADTPAAKRIRAATVPRKSTKATSQPKTTHRPIKGQKPTTKPASKRKP